MFFVSFPKYVLVFCSDFSIYRRVHNVFGRYEIVFYPSLLLLPLKLWRNEPWIFVKHISNLVRRLRWSFFEKYFTAKAHNLFLRNSSSWMFNWVLHAPLRWCIIEHNLKAVLLIQFLYLIVFFCFLLYIGYCFTTA